MSKRIRSLAAAVVSLALLCAAPALADFGDFEGADAVDPSDSPREDTPNDPRFDPCEDDDAEPPDETNEGEPDCSSYFSEQFNLFGFRPDSAESAPGQPTKYANCPGPRSQLDEQGQDANEAAGDDRCAQISGVRADSAWKYSTGDPDVAVAILDTGIRWQDEELVDKIALKASELPTPQVSGSALRNGVDCNSYVARDDADGKGGFNVADFACDPRVKKDGGDEEADKLLDGSDLIAAFSDETDDDRNGYVDDIAGWDFFDDDNDPYDASSCCSAGGHGTGRAREAAAATNNGRGEASLCPECQIMPMRVWDSFVVDTNLYALATVYAADNGADVVEGAVGGLLNSNFARRAFRYADQKGVALTLVSSDINSANHNYPTNYNEAIYIAGSLPDSAPGENCEVPGLPGLPSTPVEGEVPGCKPFLDLLEENGVDVSMQPATTSFFRNSNLTQYGGKNDVVLVGSTGSVNTGQASGAAGLLKSYARKEGRALSGNEVRQLLTMTAEDVQPENTGAIGLPDRANDGWDSHFGYGRVNMAGAMARIRAETVPPEAQIDSPDWFAPVNVDRVGTSGVPVTGRVGGGGTPAGSWRLEYACGQEAEDDTSFEPVPGAGGTGARNGELGRLSEDLLEELAEDCPEDGKVEDDAGRPAGVDALDFPADPYPDPDPERHVFQIRLTVEAAGNSGNIGRYRKSLHAYRDDGNLAGWPRPLGPDASGDRLVSGSGGESSPRFADLDADDRLDVILPTSSGEVHVLGADGRPLPSFNHGEPVRTDPYAQARAHQGAGGPLTRPPLEPLRVPAVGDVTGDGEPEIVVTAGEHVYAWHRDGREVDGFPARVDPRLSEPCKAGKPKPCFNTEDRYFTSDRHLKRGFFASPALVDLDEDGRLDIVATALDQHLYAFSGGGRTLKGFPRKLDGDGDDETGAEFITSPTIADLDGDGDPEVVAASNEVVDAERSAPDNLDLLNFFVGQATGNSVTYAVHGDGKPVDGWPVKTGVLAGDILPLVLPAHDAAAGDLDPASKGDEVAITAGTGLGGRLVSGAGKTRCSFSSTPGPTARVTDRTQVINLADYPTIGRLSASGPPAVVKGGLTLNGAANLLAVNQNLPFNHVVQAWNPTGCGVNNGAPTPYLTDYPVATDDFQLVSQPVIAKAGGRGGGRQALVGTGLYQLHAYGEDGREPPGWPKFTGGWTQPIPSVGDVSGDGKLDVMSITREGFAFIWSTGVDSCEANGTTTNNEWWTFHHDEHGTANYGHDARPPSRPQGLQATTSGSDLRLSFRGSGDDLACGRAARYEVAGSDQPIRSGADFVRAQSLATAAAGRATRADGGPVALTAGGAARFRHVAVRAVDDAGNRSYVAAESAARGDAGPGGGGDDDGDGGPGSRRSSPGSQAQPLSGTAGAEGGGRLPFTGLVLGALLVLGIALALGGRALRRRAG